MSGLDLAVGVAGVVLALVAGLVASPGVWAVERRRVLARPGGHGAPVALWRRLVARELSQAGWRVVLLPPLLVLYLVAGLARIAAVLVRLTDLGLERGARALDAATETDPRPIRRTDWEDL